MLSKPQKTVERKGKGTCTHARYGIVPVYTFESYFVWNLRVVRAGERVRRLGVRAKEGESFCVLDGESF
jgi:hypothetical protein